MSGIPIKKLGRFKLKKKEAQINPFRKQLNSKTGNLDLQEPDTSIKNQNCIRHKEPRFHPRLGILSKR